MEKSTGVIRCANCERFIKEGSYVYKQNSALYCSSSCYGQHNGQGRTLTSNLMDICGYEPLYLTDVKNEIEKTILDKAKKSLSNKEIVSFVYDLSEEEMFYFYKDTEQFRNGDGMKPNSFAAQVGKVYGDGDENKIWKPFEWVERINTLIRIRIFDMWEKQQLEKSL